MIKLSEAVMLIKKRFPELETSYIQTRLARSLMGEYITDGNVGLLIQVLAAEQAEAEKEYFVIAQNI